MQEMSSSAELAWMASGACVPDFFWNGPIDVTTGMINNLMGHFVSYLPLHKSTSQQALPQPPEEYLLDQLDHKLRMDWYWQEVRNSYGINDCNIWLHEMVDLPHIT
jgi:hypothetical protein